MAVSPNPNDPYAPTADELSYFQNTGGGLLGGQPISGSGADRDERVKKFLAPHLRGGAGGVMPRIGGATQLQMLKMASNPYQLPEGMLTTSLKRNEDLYSTARGRIKAAGAASGQSSGGETGGVQKAMEGNVEMARAAGGAESLRAYDEVRTKIGDERMANIVIPYVQEYERQYADALSKLKPKKKKNWLKAVAGVAATVVGSVYGQPWLVGIGAGLASDSGVLNIGDSGGVEQRRGTPDAAAEAPDPYSALGAA